MNDMTVFGNNEMTMSSRDIAELTGKRHDHVMRDIRVMLVELHGESEPPSFGGIYLDAYDREQQEFRLPKREALILTSGYSVKQRAAIIDRWQQLEQQAAASAFRIPQNLPEALRLAAELADKVEAQKAAIEAMKPKANGFDRIAGADGSLCLTDAAKELQRRPRDFISWLSANHWIYKRAGSASWIGYQDKIQSCLLEHKSNIVIDADGRERIRDQVRVTGKGLARLAEFMVEEAA